MASLLLAFFKVSEAIVALLQGMEWGYVGTGLMVAGSFLLIGMFIDAIPAIIILGTVLWPVAEAAGYHPIHFATIGVVALAFGWVPPVWVVPTHQLFARPDTGGRCTQGSAYHAHSHGVDRAPAWPYPVVAQDIDARLCMRKLEHLLRPILFNLKS